MPLSELFDRPVHCIPGICQSIYWYQLMRQPLRNYYQNLRYYCYLISEIWPRFFHFLHTVNTRSRMVMEFFLTCLSSAISNLSKIFELSLSLPLYLWGQLVHIQWTFFLSSTASYIIPQIIFPSSSCHKKPIQQKSRHHQLYWMTVE